MNFVITTISFDIGGEPVTIVTKNPFGGLTNFETTQTALDAERTDVSAPWGDTEVLAVLEQQLPARFPDLTGLTVALQESSA